MFNQEENVDIQISELIEKIKKEGIETAQTEAMKLKAEAEDEAKKIIEAAKTEAGAIIAKANEDARRNEASGIAALEQASRNLILSFKVEIQKFLDKLVADTVASSYSAEVIKKILPELIKNWAEKNTDSLTVLLGQNDLAQLDTAFRSQLASALKGGVELKPEKAIGGGFRIAEKDGSVFYDFSALAVAGIISSWLNPKLAEILKSTAADVQNKK